MYFLGWRHTFGTYFNPLHNLELLWYFCTGPFIYQNNSTGQMAAIFSGWIFLSPSLFMGMFCYSFVFRKVMWVIILDFQSKIW